VHAHQGYLDWDWLLSQQPVEQFTYTRHIRFAAPLIIRINGHLNKGVILKAENAIAKPPA
jgi:hypothetical protein